MLLIFFGLPGAGKSYAARVVADELNLKFHDGDDDLPEQMRKAIAASQPVTDTMRDEFFAALITHVRQLRRKGFPLAVAQTFIKEKYRLRMLEAFPMARFVLIEASDAVRERRLAHRSAGMHLEPGYARRMAALFEPPQIPHIVLRNDLDGDAEFLADAIDLLDSSHGPS